MVDRLAWTLIHFVWEGALVAAVLAILLWSTRRASASLRYSLACAGLILLVACPVVTFFHLTPRGEVAPVAVVVRHATSHFTVGETIVPESPIFPIVVKIWALGVALLSVRFIGTLVHVERWKWRYTRPAAIEWQDRVDTLARRMGMTRGIRVLVSDRIGVPSAWGVFKAVVVLPASMLAQLSPAQVETILLHELAHIRRHDYLVNLIQTVLETALFYHPAVWWISSVVRREREHCCDDVVVSMADPMPYARALLHLEERRTMLPRPTLSAKGSNLMNRIARILGAKPAPIRISPLASTMAALGVLAAVMGGTLQAQAQGTKTKPQPVPPKVTKTTVKVRPVESKSKSKSKRIVIVKPAPAAPAKPAQVVRPAIVAHPVPTVRPGKPATAAAPAKPSVRKPAIVTGKVLKADGGMTTIISTPVITLVPSAKPATVTTPAAVSLFGKVNVSTTPAKDAKTVYGIVTTNATTTIANVSVQVNPKITTTVPARIDPFVTYRAPLTVVTTPQNPFIAKEVPVKAWNTQPFIKKFDERQFAALETKAFKDLNGQATWLSQMNKIDTATKFNWSTMKDFPWKVTATASQVIDIDLKNARLSETLRTLAKKGHLSMVINSGNYEDVTIVLTNVSITKAIDVISRAAGATFRLEGGVYYISPRKTAP